MGRKVFQQNKTSKAIEGGPLLIEILFERHEELPEKDHILPIVEKHVGNVEYLSNEKGSICFSAKDYPVEFSEGKAFPMLMLNECTEFIGKDIDEFTRSQMWDAMDEKDSILSECKYQMLAIDMLSSPLEAKSRANLLMDYLDSLAEAFPKARAFYFPVSGKLFSAEKVKGHGIPGPDRFIFFAVNVRFFTIDGTDDMLIDTVGMSTLMLPDLQYHFHSADPDEIVNHAYNTASYILANNSPIKSGETIDGTRNGKLSREVQWKCQYEESLIQPTREVLDINMGPNASGTRK